MTGRKINLIFLFCAFPPGWYGTSIGPFMPFQRKGVNIMKRLLSLTICTLLITAGAGVALADEGMDLFVKHCAICHPDGGNIINPLDTLQKKNLEKEGIKDWKGIVKIMRNPGPGMTKFDEKAIAEKDAKAIAEYILKTFK